MTRPTLVGETALPWIAEPLGMSAAAYLRTFARESLLDGDPWSAARARGSAEVLARRGGALVLVGSRVRRAFDLAAVPPYSTTYREGVWYGTLPASPEPSKARALIAKILECLIQQMNEQQMRDRIKE